MRKETDAVSSRDADELEERGPSRLNLLSETVVPVRRDPGSGADGETQAAKIIFCCFATIQRITNREPLSVVYYSAGSVATLRSLMPVYLEHLEAAACQRGQIAVLPAKRLFGADLSHGKQNKTHC